MHKQTYPQGWTRGDHIPPIEVIPDSIEQIAKNARRAVLRGVMRKTASQSLVANDLKALIVELGLDN
jgi:hypothetical protein